MKLMKCDWLSIKPVRLAPIIGAAMLAVSSVGSAADHNGPPVTRATYKNYTFPVPTRKATLPRGCQSFWNNIFYRCARSKNLELALEREFWAHVQNTNFNGMRNLIGRIKNYAEYSRTPYKGRLIRLTAFGNVMLSQQTRGLTLDKVPALLSAKVLAETSNAIQPNHAFTESITGFTDSMLKYALGLGSTGDAIVERLLDGPNDKGEYGLEEAAVGAMSLTYTTDINRIYRGLAILNDCKDPICTRTSSVAPFKQVGMMLTIAEGYAAVGDKAGARRMVRAANRFATRNKMAAAKRTQLKKLGEEILGNKFMRQSQRLKGIGMYRQPAGPSQDAAACALCHQGAVVPDYYYSWK